MTAVANAVNASTKSMRRSRSCAKYRSRDLIIAYEEGDAAVAQNFDKIAQVAVGNIVRVIAKEGDAKADTTSATGRKPYEPDVLIPVTLKLGDTTR